MKWWRGQGSQPNPFDAYEARFAEIRAKIPSDLVWLQDASRLHDAAVRNIEFDSESNVLTLDLLGIRDLGAITIQERRFLLRYEGITRFKQAKQTANPRQIGTILAAM